LLATSKETAVAAAIETSSPAADAESADSNRVEIASAEETASEKFDLEVAELQASDLEVASEQVEEDDESEPESTLAIESATDDVRTTASASVRIAQSKADEQDTSSEPARMVLTARDSDPAFETNDSRPSPLAVAPPVHEHSEPGEAKLALSAGEPSSGKPRFYFDRDRTKAKADAQPAAFVAGGNDAVVLAGSNSSTGLLQGPDQAPAYSHHKSYSWLRGKLEYSSAARRWKLRYIPIDGQTDQYGGSVVLAKSSDVEQFRPGDMVTVEGELGAGRAEHGSFSPLYELRSIRSQR
jgi:hypothetical protein